MNARYRGPQDLRVLVGRAGEEATRMALDSLWLPSEPWRASAFMVDAGRLSRSMDQTGREMPTRSDYAITPDLWLPSHSALVECKGSMAGRRFYVTRRQFEAYVDIMQNAVFPIRPRMVYYSFVVFAHPVPTIGEPLSAVEKRVRDNVDFIAIVSHDIVDAWAREFGDYGKDWGRRDTGEIIYENYYRLTVDRVRKKVDALSRDPGEFIVEEGETNGKRFMFIRPDVDVIAFDGPLPTQGAELFAPHDRDETGDGASEDFRIALENADSSWRYDASWM